MHQNIKLFEGIKVENLRDMLECISAYEKFYQKNSFIILAGDKVESIGIVLEGSVDIIKESIYGDRRILTTIENNGIFLESLVAAKVRESPVSVIAKKDSKVLFIPINSLLITCAQACDFHNKLIQNLVSMMASKNIFLMHKLDYYSAKTIREKIAKYLFDCLNNKDDEIITISYNRNELAEYLGSDRSVLSRELSKLKKEGIIDFHQNTFHILKPKVLFSVISCSALERGI